MDSIVRNRQVLCLIVALLVPAMGASSACAQCAHGDLDGNGNVDLTDYAAFVECATGTFGGPSLPRCGPVDFDGDGDVDILDFGVFQRLFGTTHGVPFGSSQFDVGDHPRSVAIGDLDGDGHPDLAVANWDCHNITVLLGNGDGTFQGHGVLSVGDNPRWVTLGDLDGEGDLDLAVANRGSDNVSVLLNLCIP